LAGESLVILRAICVPEIFGCRIWLDQVSLQIPDQGKILFVTNLLAISINGEMELHLYTEKAFGFAGIVDWPVHFGAKRV